MSFYLVHLLRMTLNRSLEIFLMTFQQKWSRLDWNRWWPTPRIIFRITVLASNHDCWISCVCAPVMGKKYWESEFCLTLWEPGYNIFVLWNRPKISSCQLPYQRHSSSTDCARELFKPWNESASLLACTRKKFLVGVAAFLWVTS